MGLGTRGGWALRGSSRSVRTASIGRAVYERQSPGQGLRFGDGCLWDPLENADFYPRPYPAVRCTARGFAPLTVEGFRLGQGRGSGALADGKARQKDRDKERSCERQHARAPRVRPTGDLGSRVAQAE